MYVLLKRISFVSTKDSHLCVEMYIQKLFFWIRQDQYCLSWWIEVCCQWYRNCFYNVLPTNVMLFNYSSLYYFTISINLKKINFFSKKDVLMKQMSWWNGCLDETGVDETDVVMKRVLMKQMSWWNGCWWNGCWWNRCLDETGVDETDVLIKFIVIIWKRKYHQ